MNIQPSFAYEMPFWQQGVTLVAGIDEVGMGCLAGPVVAAAVSWSAHEVGEHLSGTIKDSKKLTPQQRGKADIVIKNQAIAWGIGVASVEEINEYNIRNASFLAMERAVKNCAVLPEILLVDGNQPQLDLNIKTINVVKGDQLSYSIAAASIVAKVYRDTLMHQLDETYPNYGFAAHKGYGTPVHLAALHEHGPTPVHRIHYAPVAAELTKKALSA